jgi:prepilin-type N-terminal cleavage/methylation domain-containing protein
LGGWQALRDSSTNAVLKRDSGFADVEAAKSAARADARKLRKSPPHNKATVGKILLGRNLEDPTRHYSDNPDNRAGQSGFSLIELLIVIVIIMVISSMSVPNLLRSKMSANEVLPSRHCAH